MDDFLTEHNLVDFVADYKSDDVKATYTLVQSMCRYCLSRRLIAGKQLCHLHNMSVALDEATVDGPARSLETLLAAKNEKLPGWFRANLKDLRDIESEFSESENSDSEPDEKEHKREPERKRSSRSQGDVEPIEVETSSDDDEVEGDEEEDGDPDYAIEDRNSGYRSLADMHRVLGIPVPAFLQEHLDD